MQRRTFFAALLAALGLRRRTVADVWREVQEPLLKELEGKWSYGKPRRWIPKWSRRVPPGRAYIVFDNGDGHVLIADRRCLEKMMPGTNEA